MSPEDQLIQLCQRRVPDATLRRAAWHLIDWLGICLAARTSPQARAFERFATVQPGRLIAFATVKAEEDDATSAFLLGGLGNILEMDDLHNASIMHAGNTVVPAALCIGLKANAAGPALLAAIARGYETAIRIGTSAATGGYRPFMNSVACGVFGASAAASDLLNLDASQRRDALAQAGMMASGIWQCRLGPGGSKQVASANAARAGVDAARLAASGMTGPTAVLSGPLGFFAAFYPEADPSLMTRDGNGPWKLHEVSFKPYPACRHTHPAIGAALDIAARIAASRQRIDDIEKIVIRTYAAAIDFCDTPEPANDDEARFSLQHAVAVSLTDGPPDIGDFSKTAIDREAVSRLRRLIRIEKDDDMTATFPRRLAASLSIDVAGKTLEAKTYHAFGDPENQMSEADLSGKFHRNAIYAGIASCDALAIERAALDLLDTPNLNALRAAVTAAFPTQTNAQVAS